MITTALFVRTNYLNIADDTFDDLLDVWIELCQNRIESFCNTSFESKLYQNVEADGNGKSEIIFANLAQVSNLASVHKRDDVFSAWESETLSDYAVSNKNGVPAVYAKNGFTEGTANYKFTFTAGYTTIPSAIVAVCCEMVKTLKDESEKIDGTGRLGLSTVSRGISGFSENTTFANLWEMRWIKMLQPFRVYTV